MSIDALLQAQAVKPTKDSQDKAGRDQRHDGPARRKEGEGHENVAQPQLNAYGEVIGQTINIVV